MCSNADNCVAKTSKRDEVRKSQLMPPFGGQLRLSAPPCLLLSRRREAVSGRHCSR